MLSQLIPKYIVLRYVEIPAGASDISQEMWIALLDRILYLAAAQELEHAAREFAEDETEPVVAVDLLVAAAGPRLSALRRAHRHLEFLVSDGGSTDRVALRAFFYLSAARIRLERSAG